MLQIWVPFVKGKILMFLILLILGIIAGLRDSVQCLAFRPDADPWIARRAGCNLRMGLARGRLVKEVVRASSRLSCRVLL